MMSCHMESRAVNLFERSVFADMPPPGGMGRIDRTSNLTSLTGFELASVCAAAKGTGMAASARAMRSIDLFWQGEGDDAAATGRVVLAAATNDHDVLAAIQFVDGWRGVSGGGEGGFPKQLASEFAL